MSKGDEERRVSSAAPPLQYETMMRSSHAFLHRRDLASYDEVPLYFAWERLYATANANLSVDFIGETQVEMQQRLDARLTPRRGVASASFASFGAMSRRSAVEPSYSHSLSSPSVVRHMTHRYHQDAAKMKAMRTASARYPFTSPGRANATKTMARRRHRRSKAILDEIEDELRREREALGFSPAEVEAHPDDEFSHPSTFSSDSSEDPDPVVEHRGFVSPRSKPKRKGSLDSQVKPVQVPTSHAVSFGSGLSPAKATMASFLEKGPASHSAQELTAINLVQDAEQWNPTHGSAALLKTPLKKLSSANPRKDRSNSKVAPSNTETRGAKLTYGMKEAHSISLTIDSITKPIKDTEPDKVQSPVQPSPHLKKRASSRKPDVTAATVDVVGGISTKGRFDGGDDDRGIHDDNDSPSDELDSQADSEDDAFDDTLDVDNDALSDSDSDDAVDDRNRTLDDSFDFVDDGYDDRHDSEGSEEGATLSVRNTTARPSSSRTSVAPQQHPSVHQSQRTSEHQSRRVSHHPQQQYYQPKQQREQDRDPQQREQVRDPHHRELNRGALRPQQSTSRKQTLVVATATPTSTNAARGLDYTTDNRDIEAGATAARAQRPLSAKAALAATSTSTTTDDHRASRARVDLYSQQNPLHTAQPRQSQAPPKQQTHQQPSPHLKKRASSRRPDVTAANLSRSRDLNVGVAGDDEVIREEVDRRLPSDVVWPPGMSDSAKQRLERSYHPIAPPGTEHLVTDEHWKDYWTWLNWYSAWQVWYLKSDKTAKRPRSRMKEAAATSTLGSDSSVSSRHLSPPKGANWWLDISEKRSTGRRPRTASRASAGHPT